MPNLYRANYSSYNYNNEENRAEKIPSKNSPKKKKFTFKQMRKNTVCSLNDVEKFLGDFKHASKYIKLYKIFK